MNSAFPKLHSNLWIGTAYVIKNQKKIFSSHNPKTFQKIDKQFLEKLEEENDLYLDYMNNLDRFIFSE